MCNEGCNAKFVKNVFSVLAFLASIAAFILMIYGAAKVYTISRSDAATSSGVDFSTILSNFLDCRAAADSYFYDSDVNEQIRYQACLPQAGPVFFFIITALFVLLAAVSALYASFKETNGSLWIASTFVSLSILLLFVGIFVMADEGNTTLVQLIPCDGRLSDSEQTLLNTVGIFPIQGKCADGLAGTNSAAHQFEWAMGGYYVGSAIGLISSTIFMWGLAYTFTKNAHGVVPEDDAAGSLPMESAPPSASGPIASGAV